MATHLKFSMYLDEDLWAHYRGNTLHDVFGDGIPFSVGGSGERAALRKFARNARKKSSAEPRQLPVVLLTCELDAESALEHILKDDIQVINYRPEPTVLFMRPLEPEHYPRLSVEMHLIEENLRERLFQTGTADLSRKWSELVEAGEVSVLPDAGTALATGSS